MKNNTTFKQTEIGMIPSDWEVVKLGNVSEIRTGPFGSSLHEKDYVTDGTPIITVEHLGEFGIVHKNMPMVSDKDKKRLISYSMQPNDIVFSRVGSVDRNSMVTESEQGWLFSGRLLRIRIVAKNVSPKYLSFYFQQETFKQRIRSVAVGQTMASLNTQILKGVDVVLPPTLAEQKAIATALNDADALIQTLEQLIAKKRNIKTGAMQELLKPKKGWEMKKLGEIGNFKNGINKNNEDFGFGFPFVNLLDIFGKSKISSNAHLGLINTNDNDKRNYDLIEGDVLFIRSSVKPEGVGLTVLIDTKLEETVFSGFIIRFRDRGYLSKEFKEHCFNSEDFRKRLISKSSVSANTNISQDALKNLDLSYPKDKKEQTRIARILSDMDNEIQELEKQLEKYKMIKQGMMQNLLTGKIRLI